MIGLPWVTVGVDLPREKAPDLPEPEPREVRRTSTASRSVRSDAPSPKTSRLKIDRCWAPPPAEEADDGHDFKLNAAQLKIHRAVEGKLSGQKGRPTVTAIMGGWGGGKTANLIFLAQRFALERPGRTVLVVVDTADRYLRVHVPECEKWLEPNGWVHRVRYREWWHPGTNSRIVFVAYFRPKTRSSSHNPLEGINADANVALIDEAQTLPKEAADKITGRLRAKGYPPQLIIFGLPVWGAWWVEMAEKEGGCVIRSTSHDNAANLDPGFFAAAKARLTTAEYKALVDGLPQAPEGLVYACWRSEHWPIGNVLPDAKWRYHPSMETRIAIDPGVEKPHALIVVHDDDPRWGKGGADIIVGEVGGERMALSEFTRQILATAWPRSDAHAPAGRYLLDGGVIDRAGRRAATSMNAPMDVRVKSWRDSLLAPAGPGPDAGIGLALWSPEGERNIIMNGVPCVVRWMEHHEHRRLFCLQSVWDAKPSGGARGLRKAIETYVYSPTTGQPVKHGDEDPLDALRYLAVRYEWIAPVGSVELAVEQQATRASAVVRSMDSWHERGGGGFASGDKRRGR